MTTYMYNVVIWFCHNVCKQRADNVDKKLDCNATLFQRADNVDKKLDCSATLFQHADNVYSTLCVCWAEADRIRILKKT